MNANLTRFVERRTQDMTVLYNALLEEMNDPNSKRRPYDEDQLLIAASSLRAAIEALQALGASG